ncbi:hypothetical protein F4677DRAFT_444243 [Hypoxylon crocopeplum]|nr:hypothetical protein F4677DRAFT_444243 [Hypoxylon crocopeplum]
MSGNWTSPTPHGSSGGTSQVSQPSLTTTKPSINTANQIHKPQGPPYASTMAIVGGEPSPSIDDPIAAVLLLLFLLSAGAHLAILRVNKQRQLKFVFSGMLFALCLLRGISLVARMVWASYPRAVNAVIAASVMTQCGSVLIFVINLFFAQRVLRAYHPRLGWHRGAGAVVWFLIACVMCCLVMAIIATIHSFFTLNKAAQRADRAVQLFAGSYLFFLAFLPVPVVALAAATTRPRYRRRASYRVEKFGAGRWRAKVSLLVFTSLVAALGAGFRVGVNLDGRSGADAAWFHGRACYYCFNFVTDLVVSTAYLLARFDRRFIVPDGARRAGDYAYTPIRPCTSSGSNLVTRGSSSEGKLPLMGTTKPVAMMRKPPSPSIPSVFPEMMMCPSPSRAYDNNGFLTDSSNTAVHNSPTTSSSFNRGKLPLSPSPQQSQSRPKTYNACKSGRRSRRALMMRSVRVRINSEADVYGPDSSGGEDADPLVPLPASRQGSVRAPAPAYLGPPILPDLDLDLELLSATLLAPWALDNWGFDIRRGSRNGSLRSSLRGSSTRASISYGSGGMSGSGSTSGRARSSDSSSRSCTYNQRVERERARTM